MEVWEKGHEAGVPERPAMDLASEVLFLGRSLVSCFPGTVYTTGRGLASTVLPAGDVRFLVLGIPVPVFGYLGDNDQEVQRAALGFLTGVAPELEGEGWRIGLRTFAGCFRPREPLAVLDWFPRLRSVSLRGSPYLLGVQLVTVYPLTRPEIARWPVAPPALVEAVERIERSISGLYERLDATLAAFAAEQDWQAPLYGM